ncbi:MAG TPA: plastocyanin/azurin family copper-binding protein [Solirubrobacteraceae bacterium]|nr:plastocyanin/azurin family copper-binding protein [Solirubrobacteraceae bacterium]
MSTQQRHLKIPSVSAAALALSALAATVPGGALAGGRATVASARAHAASTRAVALSGFSFRPSTLTIRRGDSVRWSWNIRGSEHNVTFRSVHSRTGSRGSLTVRFPRAGTFSYICTVHVNKGMRGKVVVR